MVEALRKLQKSRGSTMLQRRRRAHVEQIVEIPNRRDDRSDAVRYPSRQPVTENVFENPESVIVRSAIPGKVAIEI